jgi:hypothetical protein
MQIKSKLTVHIIVVNICTTFRNTMNICNFIITYVLVNYRMIVTINTNNFPKERYLICLYSGCSLFSLRVQIAVLCTI